MQERLFRLTEIPPLNKCKSGGIHKTRWVQADHTEGTTPKQTSDYFTAVSQKAALVMQFPPNTNKVFHSLQHESLPVSSGEHCPRKFQVIKNGMITI